MKTIKFLTTLVMLGASTSAFGVQAQWGFEMDVAPSTQGAGDWTGRSTGNMATGGTQNAGTRSYAKGTEFTMSSVANAGGDAAAVGTACAPSGNPHSLLGNQSTYTVEARFKVTNYTPGPNEDTAFGFENNSLGSIHHNLFYGRRNNPSITAPATTNPNGQSNETFFQSSSPGPNNEFSMARIAGQGSVGGFDEIPGAQSGQLGNDRFIKLRHVVMGSGCGAPGTGPTGMGDTYFDFEDGNGWRHATSMTAAGAYSNTRSRGLIFRKGSNADVEIDYIRGVNQKVSLQEELSAVPEPASGLLCAMGAGLFALARRRR